MPYIGKSPSVGLRTRYNYTATAGQTSFTGADNNNVTLTYTDTNYSDVYLNGTLLLAVTDYASTTGTSIVLTSGASLNDVLEVVVYDIFSVADTVSATDGGTFSSNVGFGADISSSTAGTSNFRAGVNAGNSITSGGNYNVTVGDEAGTAITTGDNNVAIGYAAGDAVTTGGANVAVGGNALSAITTTASNTAVGYNSLAVSTAANNTAVGRSSLLANTSGTANVAVGADALATNTTASKNTAVGFLAGTANTSGNENTFMGNVAGTAVTTGADNTFVGSEAGDATDDGARNTAVGKGALSANCGDDNVAIGHHALLVNIKNQNVAIGSNALDLDVNGGTSVAVGHNTLTAQAPTSATDMYNTAVGHTAGTDITTGIKNTIIGGGAGSDITTGSDNVVIGASTAGASGRANAIVIGVGIDAGANNQFRFGKASNTVANEFDTDNAWTRASDERLKKNIANQTLGLDFINDLRTVKYNWKPNGELDASDAQLAHLRRKDDDGNIINDMNTTATMHNFIAQEVKAALDTAGVSNFGGWKEDEHGVQQVSREMFVIPLVKAVQELSTALDAALARIATLEG